MAAAARGIRARGEVAAAAILVAVLIGVGCGDDDERSGKEDAETATAPSPTPEKAPPRSVPKGRPGTTTPAEGRGPPTSPEDEPGGAGDEEPISSQALVTGRAGRVRPRRVQVPPFIAIHVELRSADGGPYALRFGKRVIAANRDTPSVSTTFDGLRPGRRLVGRGRSGSVVIEASAEPGP